MQNPPARCPHHTKNNSRLGLIYRGRTTLGGDPHEERLAARLESTFAELYDQYYEQHAVKHTKQPDANKKMIEFHILPVIGNYNISLVTADKIRTMHAEMGEKSGQAGANRVMQIVNAVFNFGIKHGYLKGSNPCYGLKKFKTASRDRFLTKTELLKFFEALNQEKPLFQNFWGWYRLAEFSP